MNLITTKLDVSTVIVDGYAKSKIDGIPEALSLTEWIELVRVESDKTFGFIDDLVFLYINTRFGKNGEIINLLRQSLTPSDDSFNDYDFASREYIKIYVEAVESMLDNLNNSLKTVSPGTQLLYTEEKELIECASKLGFDLFRYVAKSGNSYRDREGISKKIDDLANLFGAPLIPDKLQQFINVLVLALKTRVLTVSHKDRISEYAKLVEMHIDQFDPNACHFNERLCDGVIFAIRPDGDWIIFDPEISELQKQQ